MRVQPDIHEGPFNKLIAPPWLTSLHLHQQYLATSPYAKGTKMRDLLDYQENDSNLAEFMKNSRIEKYMVRLARITEAWIRKHPIQEYPYAGAMLLCYTHDGKIKKFIP